MIFLKHFDTSKQSLYGAGKVYVLRSSKVGGLIPIINERMRWTPGTPLKLYEVLFYRVGIIWVALVLLTGFRFFLSCLLCYRKLNPG